MIRGHSSGAAVIAAVPHRPVLADVVRYHAEEAAALHAARRLIVHAPHQSLPRLLRADQRLAAHLDGLAIAGPHAWPFCDAALDGPAAGATFVSAVRAIEERATDRFDRLLALAAALQPLAGEVVAATGWVDRGLLQGIVPPLLASSHPVLRVVGVAACGVHRTNPGASLARWVQDEDASVRSRALRIVGELGLREQARLCTVAAVSDPSPDCRIWASWSAVLLGISVEAERLLTRDTCDAAHGRPMFPLGLQALSVQAAHGVLTGLARDACSERRLIGGSGVVGDPAYVPWLIGHMSKPQTARVAAEAFSLMTGADLGLLNLEGKRPENFESGPTDDPEDPDVDMDADDGLPWPDAERVGQWWAANSARFQTGRRYFMGAPVTREHCIEVLKNGYQRQRILAAHYLCLLDPGTPLFNTSAPAWRQQRLLAQMQ
jgi:uncharacterized protein (TIGR02270 family)